MEKNPDYWFSPRRYGHGASPSTWQGWAAIVVFPLFCGAVAFALVGLLPPAPAIILFLIFMAAATFGFIAFVRKKTDGEWRWRWGERQ